MTIFKEMMLCTSNKRFIVNFTSLLIMKENWKQPNKTQSLGGVGRRAVSLTPRQ